MRFGLLFIALMVGSGAQGVSVNWTEDVAAAEARAVAENKPILWYFTGSDWCGWCKKLKADVFSVDAVAQTMNDSYVLVYADYPRFTEQDAAIRKQNRKLLRRFSGLVPGYPTMVFTLPDGLPYAKLSGGGFTAAQFKDTLAVNYQGATDMRALLARVASTFGEPQLNALLEVFLKVDGAGIPASFYAAQARELKAASEALAADPSVSAVEKSNLLVAQAMAALYLGDAPGAKTLLGDAVAVSPTPYKTTMQTATLWVRVGQLAEAITAYEAAVALASDANELHAVYYMKAVAEFQLGQFAAVVKSASSAIQAAPRGLYGDLALTYLAIAHLREGDFAKAVEATDKAILQLQDPVALQQIYYIRGMAYSQDGERDEALKALKKGLALAPTSSLAPRLKLQIQMLEAAAEPEPEEEPKP